ncbi:Caprin-2 [Dissostichus eleginoides]|uniref:Caprin-2 n=1 Tax=Dissostichus eleginoides TaxID=100907 RepID=A0AAD9B7A8_DISEL|nr:Caprin-2 [Dissostichus eleginoides]
MKTLVAALALCLLFLPVYQAFSIDMDKKIEEMEARLTKTEKQWMDHTQITESQKNDDILRELEAKLKDTEKQVEDLRAEVQGIFTAPVKGVYYFSFSANHRTTKPSGLRLMKNEEQMVSVYNHAAGNRHETAANGMTLQLEVGDHVYMRLMMNTWIFDNPSNYSTFIGFLLFSL